MENHIYSFEKLDVWKDIRILIRDIYFTTDSFPDKEKFGIVNQMRRAAVSISSNLAEGSSRTSAKDQAHFYQISYSSLMEVLSQVIVSHDLDYISTPELTALRSQIEKVSFKLNALRKSTQSRV